MCYIKVASFSTKNGKTTLYSYEGSRTTQENHHGRCDRFSPQRRDPTDSRNKLHQDSTRPLVGVHYCQIRRSTPRLSSTRHPPSAAARGARSLRRTLSI